MLSLLPLLLSLPLALSASLTLRIPPSTLLPNPQTLPYTTSATLSSGNYTSRALLSDSSTFTFRDIPSGSYLCDVSSPEMTFASMRVDVDDSVHVWTTFRGHEWDNKGEDISGAEVQVQVLGRRTFFEAKPGFNPLSLLKNPMILMSVVALAMMFGLPKLMENMDPETRAEFEKSQGANPLAALTGMGGGGAPQPSFDMAAWMAGSGSRDTSSVEGSEKAKKRR